MPITRTRILLALCALLLLALPVSAEAAPSRKKAIWGPATVNGRSQFPIYRDLGVGIWQDRVNWSVVAPTRPANPRDPLDPGLPVAGRAGRGDRGGPALRHPDLARADRGAALGERPQQSELGAEEAERLRGLRLRGVRPLPVRPSLDDLERAHPGRELHAAHPREARPPADAAHEEGARTRTRASWTPPTRP